jgi:hypothetical protein
MQTWLRRGIVLGCSVIITTLAGLGMTATSYGGTADPTIRRPLPRLPPRPPLM